MNRVIPGFGEELPRMKAERQLALQRLMKRQEEKEQELHDKIIEKLYVEPKGTAETERG